MPNDHQALLVHPIIPPPRWSPVVWLGTILSTAVLVVWVIFAFGDSMTTWILVGLLGIVYLCCLIWLQTRCQNGYYANGLLLRKLFREIPILFEDVESYALIRIRKRSLTDGFFGKPCVYQYNIIFHLRNGFKPRKVDILFPENDFRFEPFFHHLRTAIASRLARRFQNEKRFDWTPDICVFETGIELLPNAKDAMSRSVFIPWNEISGGKFYEILTAKSHRKNVFMQVINVLEILTAPFTLVFGNSTQPSTEENMVFHLYRKGKMEPEIMISCLQPNFHPGYDVFRQIIYEDRNVIL